MSARQNPLSKFEDLMERLIENPFGVIFPSKIEPTELSRKLQRMMDKGALLQDGNHWLAPNVYDIYLSIGDYQNLSSAQNSLIRQWQQDLIDYAKKRRFTLKITPILRLHTDSKLRLGFSRIEAKVEDKAAGSGTAGAEATQALSVEQLARLRAQLLPGQELPGITNANSSSANQGRGAASGSHGPSAAMASIPPTQPSQSLALPSAQLTIQLPQSVPQVYRIEKPVINIGRQLSNDIIVEDKRVSRNHAQIKYQQPGGQFAIFDLGSTNGITINTHGTNITIKANSATHVHQHVLRTGDRFTIGSYEFYFERR